MVHVMLLNIELMPGSCRETIFDVPYDQPLLKIRARGEQGTSVITRGRMLQYSGIYFVCLQAKYNAR